MRCNFPIDNSTCPIVNKDSPFDESSDTPVFDNQSDRVFTILMRVFMRDDARQDKKQGMSSSI